MKDPKAKDNKQELFKLSSSDIVGTCMTWVRLVFFLSLGTADLGFAFFHLSHVQPLSHLLAASQPAGTSGAQAGASQAQTSRRPA